MLDQTLASTQGECRCRAPADARGRRPVGRLACTCVHQYQAGGGVLEAVWGDLSLLERRVIHARSAALFFYAGDVETERAALEAAYEGFPADIVLALRQREYQEQRAEVEAMSPGTRREWAEQRLVVLYGDLEVQ